MEGSVARVQRKQYLKRVAREHSQSEPPTARSRPGSHFLVTLWCPTGFSLLSLETSTLSILKKYLFIWLHWILGAARGTFVAACRVFFVVVVLTCGIWFLVVQSLSYVRLFVTSWTACCTPSFPVQHQLLEFAQTHCPLSWWCHPTISSSIVPFSSCLQSFPASGSFPMSWLFISGGQILELPLQHQSFLRIFRVDFL